MEPHSNISKKSLDAMLGLEDRCNMIHNNRYDYTKYVYLTQHTPSIIICKEHGEFSQSLANHLSGKGCRLCANALSGASQKFTTEDFIKKAKSIHGDTYDYTVSNYKGYYAPIIISCKIHGDFTQKPTDHLHKCGCPKCGEIIKRKKYYNNKTILYYVRIEKQGFPAVFKIGITIQGVQRRFISEEKAGAKVTLLWFKQYSNGRDAYLVEQELLTEFSELKYKGPAILVKGGNSELLIKDIYDRFTKISA